MQTDTSLLEAALVGYQARLAEIEKAMAEIRKKIGTRGGSTATTPRKRRDLSAAARKRISAAQKKRWAEYKKQKAEKG